MKQEEIRVLRRKLDKGDFQRMNLPEAYWRVKVQGVQESVRPTVVNYLRKIGELSALGAGLWLSGTEGVGKTVIAALAAKEARSRGMTVYFTSVWELRECIRSRIGFDDHVSIMQRCRDVDVLILDELRVDDQKAHFLGGKELEELISFRRAHKRVTLITTRLGAGDLEESFPGLLTASEGCMVWVRVAGRNLREEQSRSLREAVYGS